METIWQSYYPRNAPAPMLPGGHLGQICVDGCPDIEYMGNRSVVRGKWNGRRTGRACLPGFKNGEPGRKPFPKVNPLSFWTLLSTQRWLAVHPQCIVIHPEIRESARHYGAGSVKGAKAG
jgi:hypothetical protein